MKCSYCNKIIREHDIYWIVYEDCELKTINTKDTKEALAFNISYDIHGAINLQCEKCYNK